MEEAKLHVGAETNLTIMPINIFTSVTSPAPDASFIPEKETDDIEEFSNRNKHSLHMQV